MVIKNKGIIMAKSVTALLTRIRKKTDSVSFLESKYADVSHYIDTGNYALNRIISGSLYKGIPSGRVVLLGGENSTGKTLISAKIAVNALLKNNYDHIFYFDSEGGGNKDFFTNFNCDLNKLEHILLDNVEDATIKVLSTLVELNQFKKESPESKFMIIIDSIGNLIPNKLLEDAAKGNQKSDMGLTAKKINGLMRGMTIPCLRADIPAIVVNHVYDDPSAMYSSKIKEQSGGKRAQYVSSVSIQCTNKLNKAEAKEELTFSELENNLLDQGTNENDESDSIKLPTEEYYDGNMLNFFCYKNRLVRPFHEADMWISFKDGLGKYDGLELAAQKYGFLLPGKKGYYKIPSLDNKQISKKQILFPENEYVWESFLDELDKKSKEDMQYSKEELVEIEKETKEELNETKEVEE